MNIKEGWKTTEFWTMLGTVFVGVLIVTGVMTTTNASNNLAFVNNIVGGLVTVASVVSYIWSRGKAKTPVVDAEKLVQDIAKLVEQSNASVIEKAMDRALRNRSI